MCFMRVFSSQTFPTVLKIGNERFYICYACSLHALTHVCIVLSLTTINEWKIDFYEVYDNNVYREDNEEEREDDEESSYEYEIEAI